MLKTARAAPMLAVTLAISAIAVGPAGAGVRTDASALVNHAVRDMRSAQSVHCIFSGGASTLTLRLDADIFKNGDVNGTNSIDGYSTRLIVISGIAYEQVNAAITTFLEHLGLPASVLQPLFGKWMTGPNSGSNGSGTDLHGAVGTTVSFASLLQIFGQNFGRLTPTGTSKIDGHSASRFRSSLDATLWISNGSKPYPAQLSANGDGGGLTITLSNWNKARVPTAPSNVVPVSSIPFPVNT
jgi:hypothetical protein